jgi:hypothetical protein
MSRYTIAREDFELFYLAELTRRKIKPLSRWEKSLDSSLIEWLKKQDLIVESIPRYTLRGRKIYEIIFSTYSGYIDYYQKRFWGKPLSKITGVQKVEGFLFGYPSCCVNAFIMKPYQKNNLKISEQRLLFHWACPNCRITPSLLHEYASIHHQTEEWYRNYFNIPEKQPTNIIKKLSLAASLALCLGISSVNGQVIPDSLHFIPVLNDQDHDGLSYAEEIFLGSNFNTDFSFPGINDNVYWTQYFDMLIWNLPTTQQTDRPYRLDFKTWGSETCSRCGATVNMGYVKIVNPLRNLEMDIDYIGLHYLTNHCFSYDGSIHSGRIDIDSLKQILRPYDINHLLPVSGDSDGDGLTDSEEDSLNFDPGNPDTNGDSIPDGAEVAEQLVRLIPKLKQVSDSAHSRIIFHEMDGEEQCLVCGSTHNMGFVEFINPETSQSYQVYFNGLHALAHGSFAYSGTYRSNQRSDVVKLYRAMKTHILHIQDDSDNDGLTDNEEFEFDYDPAQTDTDGDGICDGVELAKRMASILSSLPTSPQSYDPYVIHHPTFGHWNCMLCGEPVDMGFLELVNPLINSLPLEISYYAYHFLGKGSFACEGRLQNGQWLHERLNPIQLADYLNFVTDIYSKPDNIPHGVVIKQNYPNPFNPETSIEFYLPVTSSIRIDIVNVLGQRVRNLLTGWKPAGNHQIAWDGRNDSGKEMPGGIYFCRLTAGKYQGYRRMLLLR